MEKEKDTGIIPEFTINSNGVRIKKCCASCETHAPYDSEGPKRLCTLTKRKKIVRKDDLCNSWTLSNAINKIKIK